MSDFLEITLKFQVDKVSCDLEKVSFLKIIFLRKGPKSFLRIWSFQVSFCTLQEPKRNDFGLCPEAYKWYTQARV